MEPDDARFQMLADRVDLFNGLTASDVHKIFAKGMTQRVPKGETVFFKGTTGSQMYIILGGEVGVYDGQKRIADLSVGDTFGEMSLLSNEPRNATIVAHSDVNLFVLSEQVFQKLLTKRVAVQILLNIARTMAKRITDTNMKLREMEGR